jgi:hypothetical protein
MISFGRHLRVGTMVERTTLLFALAKYINKKAKLADAYSRPSLTARFSH